MYILTSDICEKHNFLNSNFLYNGIFLQSELDGVCLYMYTLDLYLYILPQDQVVQG